MSLTSSCLVKSVKQWKSVFRHIDLRHRLHPPECCRNTAKLSNDGPQFMVLIIGRRYFSTFSKPFLFPTRLIFRQNVRYYPKKKLLPFERNMIVKKQIEDILLYQNPSTRFYAMVHTCGIIQFFMWIFIAVTLYQIPIEYEEDEERKKRQDYFASFGRAAQQIMTEKYKISRTLVFLFAGAMFMLMSLFYPARNIRQIWLSGTGKFVKVSTFALFEREPLTIPLTAISCVESRSHSASHLPLRIQGQKFFYLVDKSAGKFYDETTFDFTVGMSRKMKF